MPLAFLNGAFVDLAEAELSVLDAGLQHGVGLFETMIGGVLTSTATDDKPSADGDDETDSDLDDLDDFDESSYNARQNGAGSQIDPAEVQAWVLDLDDHMDRLATSARQLGLTDELSTEGLALAVMETVRRSGLARARIRLTLTGGPLNLLRRATMPSPAGQNASGGQSDAAASQAGSNASPGRGTPGQPTVLIVASSATMYPEPMLTRGVSCAIADTKANPFNPMEGHKTLNYWWRLRELQLAAGKEAAEALVFSITNHLAGGCVSNAFIVRGGEVLTPIARGEEGLGFAPGQTMGDKLHNPEPNASLKEASATSGAGGVAADKPASGHLPSPVLPGITRQWAIRQLASEGRTVRRAMLTINDVLGADEIILTNSSWGALPVVKVESKVIGQGVPGPVAHTLIRAWKNELASPPLWQ